LTGSGLAGLTLTFETLAESFFTTTTSSFLGAFTCFSSFSGTSLTLAPLVYLLSGTTTTFSTFLANFSCLIGAAFSFLTGTTFSTFFSTFSTFFSATSAFSVFSTETSDLLFL
tara:strand:+ start:2401 stop:2739 length:339 start_codon:yes stop_codon:yes gene_type:complete